MLRMVEYFVGMKEFVNTLVLGAALITGLVSLYQGVPLFTLVKRVGFAILMFYLIGVAIMLIWEVASVRGANSSASAVQRNDRGGLEDKERA